MIEQRPRSDERATEVGKQIAVLVDQPRELGGAIVADEIGQQRSPTRARTFSSAAETLRQIQTAQLTKVGLSSPETDLKALGVGALKHGFDAKTPPETLATLIRSGGPWRQEQRGQLPPAYVQLWTTALATVLAMEPAERRAFLLVDRQLQGAARLVSADEPTGPKPNPICS